MWRGAGREGHNPWPHRTRDLGLPARSPVVPPRGVALVLALPSARDTQPPSGVRHDATVQVHCVPVVVPVHEEFLPRPLPQQPPLLQLDLFGPTAPQSPSGDREPPEHGAGDLVGPGCRRLRTPHTTMVIARPTSAQEKFQRCPSVPVERAWSAADPAQLSSGTGMPGWRMGSWLRCPRPACSWSALVTSAKWLNA